MKHSKPKEVVVIDHRPKYEPIETTVKIPWYEKRIMEPDPPKLKIEVTTTKRITFKAWFTAFLSKNPHFKYLYFTKSSWSNNKPIYWFLNTETNVKVLLSKEEMLERGKKLSKRIGNGYFNLDIKAINGDKFYEK